ncbi:MAG: hypothetical protein KC549_02740 [Myxococcales bacterium]|nr:hypothetical protein [Myxococcales bacterium]MCB9547603.1 hypothetical protein [Myxococcales bacterium]
MRRLTGLLALALWACDDAPPPCAEPGALIADPTAWRVLSDATDPFGPAADRCPPAAHRVETSPERRWHEIQTTACHRATLAQPAQVAVCAGHTVRLDVWHFPITHTEEDWSLEVRVGGEAVIAYQAPVPREAGLVTLRGVAPGGRAADAEVTLRLANHGTNAWNLYDLYVEE